MHIYVLWLCRAVCQRFNMEGLGPISWWGGGGFSSLRERRWISEIVVKFEVHLELAGLAIRLHSVYSSKTVLFERLFFLQVYATFLASRITKIYFSAPLANVFGYQAVSTIPTAKGCGGRS